jgi:hypothetical protein
MSYVIDPASSFVDLSEDASALDSLNYPYQTLYYRGGDCDDLSILYCSLLEVLGIDTAFITIPGHIYCAFDTGIPAAEETGESWRPEGLIEQGGKLWMPVEITVPGEGFYEAWRIGARKWRRFVSQTATEASRGVPQGENSTEVEGEAKLYPMRESWAIYPSVTVPEAGDNLPEVPEEQTFTGALERELKKLEGLRELNRP